MNQVADMLGISTNDFESFKVDGKFIEKNSSPKIVEPEYKIVFIVNGLTMTLNHTNDTKKLCSIYKAATQNEILLKGSSIEEFETDKAYDTIKSELTTHTIIASTINSVEDKRQKEAILRKLNN